MLWYMCMYNHTFAQMCVLIGTDSQMTNVANGPFVFLCTWLRAKLSCRISMHFIGRGPICMYLVVWNLFYYEEMYLNGILYLLVLKFCFVSMLVYMQSY